jgi:hypothetical protein
MAQNRPTTTAPLPDQIYIRHVIVINTETGEEIQHRTVVISGDRISAVRNSKELRLAAGAQLVDGSGKYLIPGLWDMHVRGTKYDAILPLYIDGVVVCRSAKNATELNPVSEDSIMTLLGTFARLTYRDDMGLPRSITFKRSFHPSHQFLRLRHGQAHP